MFGACYNNFCLSTSRKGQTIRGWQESRLGHEKETAENFIHVRLRGGRDGNVHFCIWFSTIGSPPSLVPATSGTLPRWCHMRTLLDPPLSLQSVQAWADSRI